MLIKAEQKYVRITPRKLRLVANAVKKLSLDEAMNQLAFIRKGAARPLLKVFKQAVANAKNNHQLKEDDLRIKSLEIKKGAIYKRWQPVSRGRAHSILKRTSHILLWLETTKAQPQKVVKKAQPKRLTDQKAVAEAKKTSLKTKPDLTKPKDKTQADQKGAKQTHQPQKAGQTKVISSEGK
jgi:large subunit ribosomal protein L22